MEEQFKELIAIDPMAMPMKEKQEDEESSFHRQVTTDSTHQRQQQQQQKWIHAQDLLKKKLLLQDDFTWTIPSANDSSGGTSEENSKSANNLRYIGGVDVSFLKNHPSLACAALVVMDANTFQVVHEDYQLVHMDIPYVPGFLAFREAPVLIELLDKMKHNFHPHYPQLLMVDGNGILHPRGFGLACHLGVLADLPSIGIGKNVCFTTFPMENGSGLLILHHVDGLTQSGVRQLLEAKENCNNNLIPLIGKTGQVWGMAMRYNTGLSKPIYISIGHRISLDSSCRIVKMCCKFRVPEPIRQADIRSRAFLHKLEKESL